MRPTLLLGLGGSSEPADKPVPNQWIRPIEARCDVLCVIGIHRGHSNYKRSQGQRARSYRLRASRMQTVCERTGPCTLGGKIVAPGESFLLIEPLPDLSPESQPTFQTKIASK